ncbi:MAG: hypothetical protein ACNFW9_06350 [Candidatus Kerfeldbacteria bacterium]
MDQKKINNTSQEKDLSNSFSSTSRIKNLMANKGGSEKRLFILLIAIVVIGVPLSIWQINSQINSPFAPKKIIEVENINFSIAVDYQLPVMENLRDLDTDNDGITDYDELYRHKTSPYIADSDSDSILDKIEIDQGTDPNCPEGAVCSREEVPALVEINDELADQLENMSVDQLRQLMIDSGAPEEQVNKISDEDLLKTFQDILAEEGGTTNTQENILNLNLEEDNTNTAINLETIDYETLFNLNDSEIRALLIEGGVPQETLEQIDDELLREIYLESLGQNFEELSQQQQ